MQQSSAKQPSRYARHDQCEGQLLSFIDELSETLYNAPEGATHYAGAASSSSSSSSSAPKKNENVVELDEEGKPASAQTEAAQGVPVINKIEIPQTDTEKVLSTLMSARPELFAKLQEFMKTVLRVMSTSDDEANTVKAEGNKAFVAYQNEVAQWGDAAPKPNQKAEAHRCWEAAFNSYTLSISRAQSNELLATLLNNRSTVLFSGKQYRDSALDCNYCLKLNPSYLKALQRRAACMAKLGYEAVAAEDEEYIKKINDAAATEEEKAALTAAFNLRFDLHDTLLHAFQNVSNYADVQQDQEEEEEGSEGNNSNSDSDSDDQHKKGKKPKGPNPRVLSAATRLSAPSTIVTLSKDEIAVDRDAKRGRFITSTKQLPAGHTILVETPYALANYTHAASKACSFCLRPTRMLYPCEEFRRRGVRSRGLFCGSECAKLSWGLYGERESSNIFYAICPIDALLAARVLFRKSARAAVLIPSSPNAKTTPEAAAGKSVGEAITKDPLTAVAAFMTLAISPEERAHVNIDAVGDNKFGKDHMDALCQFSSELFPGLAEAGGRETILTAVAQFYSVFRSEPLKKEEIERLLTESLTAKGSSTSSAATSSTDMIVDVRPLSSSEKANAEQFRKILRQIPVNAFPITFQDRVFGGGGETHTIANVALGKALYAVASLFNHSCDPNCVVSFAGQPYGASGQLHIKTIRPIHEGEELTIAYTPSSTLAQQPIDKFHLHSTRARIRELRSRYGFACVCPACYNEVDEPIPKEKEQYYHKASDYYQKGRRLMREGNFGESVTVLLQSYEIVMRYICPPPAPPQWMLVNTHEALAQSYNLLGNKRKTVEHLKAALTLALQLYDKHATQIAVSLGTLALEGGDHASDSLETSEDQHHPRNHQPARPSGIVPGTPSPLALSATFLTHSDIQCHANKDILQSFVRLAHMNAAVGRADEEEHRRKQKEELEKQKKEKENTKEEFTSDESTTTIFVSNYTKDALKFSQRSIELMKKFYPESAALDAELLELELIARKI